MDRWEVVVGDLLKTVASSLTGLSLRVSVAAERVIHKGFLQR